MFSDNLRDLLSIKKPVIWVKTFEEKEALIAIKNVVDATEEFDEIYTWSHNSGVLKMNMVKEKIFYENEAGIGVDNLIKTIQGKEKEDVLETSAFILKDYHMITNNPAAVRGIRDIVEAKRNKYNAIIILSPSSEIPFEWEKLTQIVDYEDPTQEEILELINSYEKMAMMEIPNKEHLSNLFVGFSRKEIIDTISMSIIKTGAVDENEIALKKIDIIKNTGVLDYKEPKATLEEVGGNEFFKKWIEEAEFCMDDEAIQYGVPKPKGHLALGIPGQLIA